MSPSTTHHVQGFVRYSAPYAQPMPTDPCDSYVPYPPLPYAYGAANGGHHEHNPYAPEEGPYMQAQAAHGAMYDYSGVQYAASYGPAVSYPYTAHTLNPYATPYEMDPSPQPSLYVPPVPNAYAPSSAVAPLTRRERKPLEILPPPEAPLASSDASANPSDTTRPKRRKGYLETADDPAS